MPITINGDTGLSGVAGTASTPALVGTDTDTGVYYSAANTLDFATGGTAAAQLDSSQNLKFNSGYGSVATAYGCRAWVNFNGTGTVAIRASGNVSSITDRAVGQYTVNLTTAMPDANYCAVGTHNNVGGDVACVFISNASYGGVNTASACTVNTSQFGGQVDASYVFVSIFR